MSVEWVSIGPHRLACGDCRDVMSELSNIDAVVCDPPYGLEFMGKEWDKFSGDWNNGDPATSGHATGGLERWTIPRPRYHAGLAFQQWAQAWAEAALSCLKPGGYLLAFGGTRTYHRLACAIEDAGFQIRDCIMWLYGSGFPKAKSCLKPAYEPILLARKPGAKVLPLGVDECRVGMDDGTRDRPPSKPSPTTYAQDSWTQTQDNRKPFTASGLGRWPANIVHDGSDEVLEEFAKFGEKNGGHDPRKGKGNPFGGANDAERTERYWKGTGTAARFFYCAKASKADRDEGLEGIAAQPCGMMEDDAYPIKTGSGNLRDTQRRNTHPTVKPTSLMQWLVKLACPPDGTVLDCFMGSGSTGKACAKVGRKFVGIEKEPAYFDIAKRRIEHAIKDAPLLEGVA